MIALLQRVSRAEVKLEGKALAAIDRGVLALVCAERREDESFGRGRAGRPVARAAIHSCGGYIQRHAPELFVRARARCGSQALRSSRRACALALFQHGVRPLRRTYAGRSGERRPGDVLAARVARSRSWAENICKTLNFPAFSVDPHGDPAGKSPPFRLSRTGCARGW